MKTTIAITVVLLAGLVGSMALAAPEQSGAQTKESPKTFVDANNDGVCDNAATDCPRGEGAGQGCGSNFIDANNDGVCDNVGTGQCGKKGKNFVDANGDGVCDKAASGTCAGKRNGKGRNFVDANKDGVCDNAATGQCNGSGKGQGKGKGQGCGQQNRGRNGQ